MKEKTKQVLHPKKSFPKIGLRSIKTTISTTLCAILYILVDRNPTFACIGAVFGMDHYDASPWKTGGNRLIGTIIGGFLGMGLFYLQQQIQGKVFQIMLLCIGILLLIYIAQIFHCPGAIQGGAVVFYIVMLNTPHDEYITYAINRMIDTGIGVFMSICINVLFSRQRLAKYFINIQE